MRSSAKGASPRPKSGSNSPRPETMNAQAGPSVSAAQPPVMLDPYRILPSALRRPIQTFAQENPFPSPPLPSSTSNPISKSIPPPSLAKILSLTPIAYSTRLLSRQLLLTNPPTSTNPDALLTELAHKESIRLGKKRSVEEVVEIPLKRSRDESKHRKRKELGALSKREVKKRKIYKLKKGERIDWEGLLPLWLMHLGYLSDLLGLPEYEIGGGRTEGNIGEQKQGQEKGKSRAIVDPPGKTNGMNSEGILSKIIKCDMVGAKIRVKSAKNPSLIGQEGIVIQETAGTMKLVTRDSVLKGEDPNSAPAFTYAQVKDAGMSWIWSVIPKANSLFTLSFPAYALSSLPGNPGASSLKSNPDLDSSALTAFQPTYDPFSPSLTLDIPQLSPSTFEESLRSIPHIEIDILGSAFEFRTEERAGRRFKPREGGGGWEQDWVGWWGDGLV